jgi:hypothetical protein
MTRTLELLLDAATAALAVWYGERPARTFNLWV